MVAQETLSDTESGDLLITENGSKHIVVFQDISAKWPIQYPVPTFSGTAKK